MNKDDYQVINKLSIGEAIPAAVKESWQLLVYNVKQFKLILSPKIFLMHFNINSFPFHSR